MARLHLVDGGDRRRLTTSVAPALRIVLSGSTRHDGDWIAIIVLIVVRLAGSCCSGSFTFFRRGRGEAPHPEGRDYDALLLSLAFGGLLWPIAWLWLYAAIGYKLAYGTRNMKIISTR